MQMNIEKRMFLKKKRCSRTPNNLAQQRELSRRRNDLSRDREHKGRQAETDDTTIKATQTLDLSRDHEYKGGQAETNADDRWDSRRRAKPDPASTVTTRPSARPERPLGTAVRRARAEMAQEEEEQVRRLVAEHAREDRAKSPDCYRHPNYAKKPQEFWE
ncbi:hypothetical protein EDB83DRAFT_2528090 [Lactarius deliciosus]|nr:hypothetical protein EDB83DRAFT_2528090 [Lactarius deliciosus]